MSTELHFVHSDRQIYKTVRQELQYRNTGKQKLDQTQKNLSLNAFRLK